jgi:prepilin-type N-terminal cleavage/methylation domain-containing protein
MTWQAARVGPRADLRLRSARELGRRSAFTLIELMIVVAVIAILMAIAIPSLLESRISANEASAVSSLRSISTINERYRLRFQTFAGTMGNLVSAGLIESDLGGGSKSGYTFAYSGSTFSFSCTADPISPGSTGNRYFYVDTSGVIRFSTTGTATSASPPIGN